MLDALRERALDEARAERLERLRGPLAAHRAAQSFGLPRAEAGERHRHVQHLLLEDDRAVRLAERLLEQRMVVRRPERRVGAQQLAVLDVRVHGLSLDRARAHERDLHREVLEVLGPRAEEALHLRTAFDLERADGVGALDLLVDRRVLEIDAREVDRLVVHACDLAHALFDGAEHPEPEQVDLHEACVRARVLVPLAELPPFHRGRLHRDELDERPRGDDHPARMLRDVPRQARDLGAALDERAPARREQLPLGVGKQLELLRDLPRVPALGELREPLELRLREAERLADVADRAARAVRGERRDERRVLPAVALGHADDQLLADVAREVEVDVGDAAHLVVQETPERETCGDRVDVREAGQVADDRADRAAAPAAGREHVARRVVAAHLARAVGGELEHLVVEQEEAGEPQPVDERELVVEAGARRGGVAACPLQRTSGGGLGEPEVPQRGVRSSNAASQTRFSLAPAGSPSAKSG